MIPSTASTETIPVIDIGGLLERDSASTEGDEAARQIGDACRDVGFFYIQNHGIPADHLDAVFREAKRFFNLPIDRKMEIHIHQSKQNRGYIPVGGEKTAKKPDSLEALDLGRDLTQDHPDVRAGKPLRGPNQWPHDLPGFKAVMDAHWEYMIDLGARVTEGIARSLDLAPDHFEQFTDNPLHDWRLVRYPPSEDRSQNGRGIGAHIDYGFVTILAQDEVGGLEVQTASGEWISAPFIPDTFIVNIGHMVQRWTNDRYTATWHRVRLPGGRERLSIPFFFSPSYETVVEPISSCCSADNPPRYEPCHFGEYSVAAFADSYG